MTLPGAFHVAGLENFITLNRPWNNELLIHSSRKATHSYTSSDMESRVDKRVCHTDIAQ